MSESDRRRKPPVPVTAVGQPFAIESLAALIAARLVAKFEAEASPPAFDVKPASKEYP